MPTHNMKSPEQRFDELAQKLVATHPDVEHGKMMRSPGLKCNGKVFAFFHDDSMCFRLGKTFDTESFGIQTVRWLSPFKNKPPMKAWFIIEAGESDLWPKLADEALLFTRTLK